MITPFRQSWCRRVLAIAVLVTALAAIAAVVRFGPRCDRSSDRGPTIGGVQFIRGCQ